MVEYKHYKLDRGELLGRLFRQKVRPSVFVAYSFRSTASKTFRKELESKIRRTKGLEGIEVTDGHVAPGENWLAQIRKRLKRAWLVVADLTQLRPDVLFECGFAWGLGRVILPVTQQENKIHQLPSWLKDLQIGYFETEPGWTEIIDAIGKYVSHQVSRPRRDDRLLSPDPNSIYAMIGGHGLEEIRDKVETMAEKYGLHVLLHKTQEMQTSTIDLLNEVATASLFVASINGGSTDNFVHFAAGIVVAKPKAGVSSTKLTRKVLLVVGEGVQPTSLIAGGALHSSATIKAITIASLDKYLHEFGEHHVKWQNL